VFSIPNLTVLSPNRLWGKIVLELDDQHKVVRRGSGFCREEMNARKGGQDV